MTKDERAKALAVDGKSRSSKRAHALARAIVEEYLLDRRDFIGIRREEERLISRIAHAIERAAGGR